MKKAILILISTLATGSLFAQNNVTGSQSIPVYKPDTLHKFGAYTNVAYLLKKTAGFEIGDDGTVFHQGQQINIANINGKNYTGIDVARAIKMIPADKVQNIEIIDNGIPVKLKGGKTGSPQKILSILFNDEGPFYTPAMAGYRQGRMRRGDLFDPYVVRYGDPTMTDPRNPSDRYVDRAIRNMQLSYSTIGETNEYGDMIPHFIVKEWPGQGKPKVKKDTKAVPVTPDSKEQPPVQ